MDSDARDVLLSDIHGRSIVRLIRAVVSFWSLHRTSLASLLPAGAVTALDALEAAYSAIALINPPGPQ